MHNPVKKNGSSTIFAIDEAKNRKISDEAESDRHAAKDR